VGSAGSSPKLLTIRHGSRKKCAAARGVELRLASTSHGTRAIWVEASRCSWCSRVARPKPGDIVVERKGFRLYAPIATSIFVSLVLTALLNRKAYGPHMPASSFPLMFKVSTNSISFAKRWASHVGSFAFRRMSR
jgi:hypothetical protein